MTKKIQIPSKEEIYNLYIIKNLTINQLKKYYQVGQSTIDKWIKILRVNKKHEKRKYPLPSKKDFYKQYHTNNLSMTELIIYYKVPEHIIRRWIEYFGFKKTRKEIGEIRAKMFFKKHGVYNPSQLETVKEKRKETLITNYGLDNIFKDKEKIKQSYIKNLGVSNPSKLESVKQKKEQTFKKHFGVKTALQLKEVRQRQKEVAKKKYGEKGVLGNEHIKAKIKRNVQNKYGVDNVMQLQSSKDKRIETNKEKYGKEYYAQTEESKEKIKNTCLNKYGKDNYFKTEEFEKKKTETNIIKFGFDSYSKTKEFKDFIKEHHGEIQQKVYNTKKQNNSFNKSEDEEKVYQFLLHKFKQQDIVRQYRSEEYPFACDFYIKSLDLYIEYHGSWVHGGKPFVNSVEDKQRLKKWESKSKEINFKGEAKSFYSNAIYVWTKLDTKKLQTFIANKLNYKIFYTLQDFEEWYKTI